MRLTTELISSWCPYCGEQIEFVIDPSVDEQEYVEDCSVCCQPIVVAVSTQANGEREVGVRREDE